jgi:hypothetical protein
MPGVVLEHSVVTALVVVDVPSPQFHVMVCVWPTPGSVKVAVAVTGLLIATV